MCRLNLSLRYVAKHVTTAVAIATTLTLTLFAGTASAFVFDGDATNGSIILTTSDGLVHWLKHDPVSQIQGQFSTNVSDDGGVTDKPVALAVGDFDGDNNGDILIARSGGFLSWVERSGSSLTGVDSFNVSPANSIAIGEMGDGGHDDVIVGRDDGQITWAYMSPATPPDKITAYDTNNQGNVVDLVVGDFDGDGNGDVLVAKSTSTLELHWGERTGSNTITGIHNFNISPSNSIAIGDADDDGDDDVFVGRDDGMITWASWNEDLGTPQITACAGCNYNAGGVADLAYANVITGDDNDDASGDLFVISPQTVGPWKLRWLETNADTLNIQQIDEFDLPALGLGASFTSIDAGDFDGDGEVDIIVGRSEGGTAGSVGWYEIQDIGGGTFEIVQEQASFNVGAGVLDLQIIAPEAGAFVPSADFNEDTDIDGSDFLIWQRGFNAAGVLAQGDADDSGFVDAADLAIWEAQYGVPPLNAAASSVPEPGAITLLLLGWITAIITRRPAYAYVKRV